MFGEIFCSLAATFLLSKYEKATVKYTCVIIFDETAAIF